VLLGFIAGRPLALARKAATLDSLLVVLAVAKAWPEMRNLKTLDPPGETNGVSPGT
jgi:hypothetical protein